MSEVITDLKEGEIYKVAETLLALVVCSPFDAEQTAAMAKEKWHPGTKAGWVFTGESFSDGESNPGVCATHANRKHFLLFC